MLCCLHENNKLGAAVSAEHNLYRNATCTHFGYSLYITCLRVLDQLHVAGSGLSKQSVVEILLI